MSAIKGFIFGILPGILILIFTSYFWTINYTNKIKNKYINYYGDSIFYIKYCNGDFDDSFTPVYKKEDYKKIRIKECQQLKVILN